MRRERLRLRGKGRRALAVAGTLLVLALARLGRPLVAQPALATALLVGGALAAWLTRDRWWHATADLGIDGVAFEGRKGKLPSFVRWSEVREVRRQGDRVVLVTARGPVMVEPLDAAEVHERLQRRLESFRRRERVEVPAALLAEEPDEGAYRQASLPADVLVRVAADPGNDDEVRALAAELAVEEGERRAVEQLAEATVDPAMRAFLRRLLG